MQIVSKNFSDPNAGNVKPADPQSPALYYAQGGTTLWTWGIETQEWTLADN